MAIDIRYIVNVYPSILPPGAQGLELNGLLFSRTDLIPIGGEYNGILQFTSAADVGSYFGTLSDEYYFATKYFLGYDNSFRRPRRLFIAAYYDQPRTAWLQGNPITPILANFKNITSGDLTVEFSGVSVSITPVNLSTVTSFSEVAQIVETAVRDAAPSGDAGEVGQATVTYSSLTRAFRIQAGGTGADGQTIGPATGAVADAMLWDADHSPTISAGTSGATAAAILEAIKDITQNWATFTSLWKATTEEKIAFAQWQALYSNSFLYVTHDDDSNLLIAQNTNNDASILAALNIDCAFVYGGYVYAAFIMGMAASIDYTGFNSVITFAHKAQTGLPYNVNHTSEARALEDKGVNFYGNYALRNDQFQFLFPGRTLGSWRWIDHYVNSIWFFSALETSAAFGLHYASRVPYNQPGFSLIRSFYMDPINAATQNGTIDAGLALSETQKAIIIQQAGHDITPDLERNGYYLQIRDPGPAVRVNRDSTDNKLWYTYAGSVHRLDLAAISIT